MPDPYGPIPGADPLGPWDFAQLLRNIASQQTIVKGPGGSYIILDLTQNRFSMDDTSIQGAPAKTDVKTNDPKLDEPALAGLGLWSTQFAQTFLGVLFGTTEQPPGAVDDISSLEDLEFRQAALHTFSEEEGLEFPGTGGITPPPGNTAFVEWLTELKKISFHQSVFLSAEMNQILTATHSSDEATVYAELVNLADLQSLSLTGDQKATIMDRLQKLAKAIAEKNAVGGAFVLNVTIPILVLTIFSDTVGLSTDISIPPATRDALLTALSNISSAIAEANYENLVHRNPTDQNFLALTSKDPKQIGQALATLTGGYTPPPGVSASEVDAALSTIANVLSTLSPEEEATLESVDRKGLTDLFSLALGSAVNAGTISATAEKEFLASLVPLLVDKVYDVNYAEHAEGLRSPDPKIIDRSLKILTGINSDKRLSPTTRKIAMSYIQALIAMLEFMAQVRAFISISQGTLSENLAQAKMATASDECTTAMTLYKDELAKIQKEYEKNLSDLQRQELMKRLMPLIAIGVAVTILVASIVTLIISIPTGGIAAPMSLAALTALITAIIGTIGAVLALVLTCIDSGLQLAGKTSMWIAFANALGITNSTEQMAFITAFQLIMQLGISGASCLVSIGMASAKAAVEDLLEEVSEISSTLGKAGEAAAEGAAEGVAGAVGTGLKDLERGLEGGLEGAASEAGEGSVSELIQLAKKAAVSSSKLAKGGKAAEKTLGQVSRKEMMHIAMKIMRNQIIIAVVCSLFGSGLLTEGLSKLGQLIFKDSTDAMIFTIIMSIAIMILGMYATKKICGEGGKAEGVGIVEKDSPEPGVAPDETVDVNLTPVEPHAAFATPELSASPPKPIPVEETPPSTPPPTKPLPRPPSIRPPSSVHTAPEGGEPLPPGGEGLPPQEGGEFAEGGLLDGNEEGAPPPYEEEGPGENVERPPPPYAPPPYAPPPLPGTPPPEGVPLGLPTTEPGSISATPSVEGGGGTGGGGGGAGEGGGEAGGGFDTAAPASATAAPSAAPASATAAPSAAPATAAPTAAAATPGSAPATPTTSAATAAAAATGTPTAAAAPATAGTASTQTVGMPTAPASKATKPGEGGSEDESISTGHEVIESFKSSVEKLRKFFLNLAYKWISKLQDLTGERSEAQWLAEAGETIKGGVSALKNAAQKLLSSLKRFIQWATGKLAQTGKSPLTEALLTKMSKFAKEISEALDDALFIGKDTESSAKLLAATHAWMNAIKTATTIVKLWASITDYRLHMKQAKLDKLLAELEIDKATLESVMHMFNQLSGIDQTQTIQDLGDDAVKQFEAWTSLLEMVSGFIEGAGQRVNELVSKANK